MSTIPMSPCSDDGGPTDGEQLAAQIEVPAPRDVEPQPPAALCEQRPQLPVPPDQHVPELLAALDQLLGRSPKADDDDDDDDGLILKLTDRLIAVFAPILRDKDWEGYLMLMGVLILIGIIVVLILVL
jgi:hypothetical protein